MSQRVVLSLGIGDLYSGFPAVTAYLWEGSDPHPIKWVGSLPPAPKIAELYRFWQLLYEALHLRLDWHPRIEIEAADVTNVSQVEFSDLCQQLARQMNSWLNSEPFRSIDQPLRTQLNATDEIRLLIETNDRLLQKLPWHLWNFFEHYPKSEVAFSAVQYQRSPQVHQSTHRKVRILAVLGDSRGIDIDQDRSFLAQLSDQAEIEFLVEPHREQLNDRLWQQWDLLFFAGHSSSQEQGLIQINPDERLPLEQLRYGLKRAIEQGLKLAIFNSCDGLDLARQLADLSIPQVIVMREPVTDVVAQTFLKYFLAAFSQGQSLCAAVRTAREQLQGLENHYPCASWLPVVYQNPAVAPTTWDEWRSGNGKKKRGDTSTRNSTLKPVRVLLSSAIVTGLVMGVRWLGWLQPSELQAYDQLMRLRPIEPQDQRLLIVTVTEEDLQLPEQQQRKGSLSDLALLRLLDKLEPHRPRAIGLEIYRDFSATPALAGRLRGNDRFFAVCKVRDLATNYPGVAPPPEVSLDRQGFSDIVKDADGVLRRQLLSMKPPPASPCNARYALSAQLAFHYLSAEGITAKFDQDRNLQLGNTVLQRLQPRLSGYQPVDAGGYQILLNYRSHTALHQIAPTVTLREVLAGKLTLEQVKDRIVLIGAITPSVQGDIITPHTTRENFSQGMPGVFVQAQFTSQLISAVKDGRSLITGWSLWAEVVWVWSWALIGGLLILGWQIFRNPKLALLYLLFAAGIAISALSLLSFGLLMQGTWVPLIPAVIAGLGTASSSVFWFSTQPQSCSSTPKKVGAS
jgi:CHASE2 domain-containing sensor protein